MMNSDNFDNLLVSIGELINQYGNSEYIEHLVADNMKYVKTYIKDLENWITEFCSYK